MGTATKNVKYTLDEISDDVIDVVLCWRKDVRRRQVLGKFRKNLNRVAWFTDFVSYVLGREELGNVQAKFDAEAHRVAAAFVKFVSDLSPIGHGLLKKEGQRRIDEARKG